MSYIKFDRQLLVNLEYALSKELLRSNRAGSYSSTTIIGCNTRRYHGLLITRQPLLDGEHHVLLSSIDETIIQQNTSFNLGIRKFKGGTYNPKGHKYIVDFSTEPIPKLTFQVGGVRFTKEMLFTHTDDQMLIKYTLEEAHSPTTIRLKPFMAFRNFHELSKSNIYIDSKYKEVSNGISVKLYDGYSPVYLQLSKKTEYIHVPDWYYSIEYTEEMERGYDYLEDLFVPGYFEFPLKKGESIYLIAGLNEVSPANLKKIFEDEIKLRIPRAGLENCLLNSAHQFIVKRDNKTEVIAGFPWFGRQGRETFISLPGLTLYNNRIENFKAVVNSMVEDMDGPFFPQFGIDASCKNITPDTQLWFFWTLQQYIEHTGDFKSVWKDYGSILLNILNAFKDKHCNSIQLHDNGLLYTSDAGRPMTWMNMLVKGRPVTLRPGYAVDINALWYNAICFYIELAGKAKQTKDLEFWTALTEKIPTAFFEAFWCYERNHLYDYNDGIYRDMSTRPNQIFAASLPYSPLAEDKRKLMLDKIKSELVTPRGLRSLAPKNPLYIGIYVGNQETRDRAAHQGSVHPWLIAHFAEAYLKIHGKSGLHYIKTLYNGFGDVIMEHGIGSISELYDGDPPHRPGGAISMAWNVAELLRMNMIIKKYDE